MGKPKRTTATLGDATYELDRLPNGLLSLSCVNQEDGVRLTIIFPQSLVADLAKLPPEEKRVEPDLTAMGRQQLITLINELSK